MTDITLYTSFGSGNAYKVELMLRLLSLGYRTVSVDLRRNEHTEPAFLERSPFGQVPVLEDGTEVLTDSQAILLYLAGKYGEPAEHDWAPLDPLPLALVMRWLSVAANEIHNGLAIPRAVKLLGWPFDYEQAVRGGYRILRIMDRHLADRQWLALDHATVADLACYPYVMLAAEGGVDTGPYAQVQRWLTAVEALPGFWPMPRIPGLPAVPLVPPPAR